MKVWQLMIAVSGALLSMTLAYALLSQSSPEVEEQVNFPVFTPTPIQRHPALPKYDEPEIGMDYFNFTELCGNRTRGSSSRYASVRRDVEYYAYTKQRWKKRCVGYFVFDDFVLVSMHSE